MLRLFPEHDLAGLAAGPAAGLVAFCLDLLHGTTVVAWQSMARIEARRREHIGTLLDQVIHQLPASHTLESAYTVGQSWTRRFVYSRQGMTKMIQQAEQFLGRRGPQTGLQRLANFVRLFTLTVEMPRPPLFFNRELL